MEDIDFDQNIAQESGGAIVARNKNLEIKGSRFNQNKAFTGGAIMLANGARSKFLAGMTEDFKVSFNILSENYAADGGAVAAVGSSDIF